MRILVVVYSIIWLLVDLFEVKALSNSVPKAGRKTAVLICPAQFCVPVDYTELIVSLKSRNSNIGTCAVADLPRTEWIKVASHLPSQDFLNANLKVDKTLDWYFEAIENSLAKIYSEEGEVRFLFLIFKESKYLH